MINSRNILTALSLAALILVTLIWVNLDSDERQIKNILQTISELAEKKEQEAALDSLQKAGKLAKFFHDPCSLSLDRYGYSGQYIKKEITDRILMVRARGNKISVTFHDTTIQIKEGKKANITTTMYVKGIENDSEKADVQELEIIMLKNDGSWLISDVAFVEVLQE